MAAHRGRRNVQRKLYNEEEEEDDEDEERGKTFQAGSFVYNVSMHTKRVTDKMSCFVAKKCQKKEPEPRPTSGGKNIVRKHPDSKNPMGSPVPLVIKPTQNGMELHQRMQVQQERKMVKLVMLVVCWLYFNSSANSIYGTVRNEHFHLDIIFSSGHSEQL